MSLVFKCSILKRFWFNGKDFIAVVNQLQFVKLEVRSFQRTSIVFVCFLLYSLVPVYMFLGGTKLDIGATILSPKTWAYGMINKTRKCCTYLSDPTDDLMDWKETAGAIICSFAILQRYFSRSFTNTALFLKLLHKFFHRSLLGQFGDLCILVHSVTLWTSAREFALLNMKLIGNTLLCSRKAWDDIYSRYKDLRKLSGLINRSLGSLVVFFLAEGIMYYSINLDNTMAVLGYIRKASMIILYCETAGVLFFSANIHDQVSSVRDWLEVDINRKSVPVDELQLILNELQTKKIGIHGGNLFTVSYSLIGTVSVNNVKQIMANNFHSLKSCRS